MTDAQSQTTAYTYDNAGRRLTIQWPDHVAGQTPGQLNYGIEATAYDAAGRLLRKTNQLGDTITSVYDLGGRTLSRQYRTLANSPSGTIASQDTFTFDAASRMLTGVKGLYANTVALAYDIGGRKATEALTIAGQTYTTGTAYDTAGRVSQLTYPDGSVVARTYDSRNLLSTIALGGVNIDSRSYDTGGRLSSVTLGNGLVVTRTYQTGDNLPLAISNSAVGTYTYAWDANKNKTSETITGTMAAYTSSMAFDDQNRLTAWNRTNSDAQAWTLSPVNDWQSFTNNGAAVARTHGPTHEVLTVGAAAIQHDSRGNMTTDEFAIARTYDTDGKVSQAVVPSGSARGGVGTHTYQYDALNRRVRKTIGGANASDTVFAHTGEQIVADYPAGTAATSPTTKYAWGSYIDELICQFNNTTRLYPHRNQQYSTVALSDASGAVVERYAYTSFGDVKVLDPNTLAVRTTAPMTRYTYTGREFDHETGAYHFRARPYSATLGRFTGHDPILYPDGWNTYAGWFSGNGVDPHGKSYIPPGGPSGGTYCDAWPQNCPQTYTDRNPTENATWYGCYCGGGNPPNPKRASEPIDPMDIGCKKHDSCYDSVSPSCRAVEPSIRGWVYDDRPECQQCDRNLCQSLHDADCSGWATGPERVRCVQYRRAAMQLFNCANRFQIAVPR